jgi:hypothetical protein
LKQPTNNIQKHLQKKNCCEQRKLQNNLEKNS